MKKKLFCIILVLMLLPTVFMFSACSGSGYNLNLLKDDYTKIFDYETIKLEEEKFKVTYSSYAYFNNEVLVNAPYSYLNNYNTSLTNMMSFADSYLNQISKGEYDVDASVSKQLKQELNELDTALTKLDINTQNCVEYVEFSRTPNEPHCLDRLRIVFNSYEEAYRCAFNFNSTLMEIYFSNTKIKDYTAETEFVPLLAVIDMRLEARIKQQIVYTTVAFMETYACEDFSSAIIANTNWVQGFSNDYNTYTSKINKLNKTLSEQKIEAVSNNQATLAQFKESVIKLNNMQAILDNDFKYFKTAINAINDAEVIANIAATNNEKVQSQHIFNYSYVVDKYNSELAEVVALIGA